MVLDGDSFHKKMQFKHTLIIQFICIAGKQCCIALVSFSRCLTFTGDLSEAAQGNAVVMPKVF